MPSFRSTIIISPQNVIILSKSNDYVTSNLQFSRWLWKATWPPTFRDFHQNYTHTTIYLRYPELVLSTPVPRVGSIHVFISDDVQNFEYYANEILITFASWTRRSWQDVFLASNKSLTSITLYEGRKFYILIVRWKAILFYLEDNRIEGGRRKSVYCGFHQLTPIWWSFKRHLFENGSLIDWNRWHWVTHLDNSLQHNNKHNSFIITFDFTDHVHTWIKLHGLSAFTNSFNIEKQNEINT